MEEAGLSKQNEFAFSLGMGGPDDLDNFDSSEDEGRSKDPARLFADGYSEPPGYHSHESSPKKSWQPKDQAEVTLGISDSSGLTEADDPEAIEDAARRANDLTLLRKDLVARTAGGSCAAGLAGSSTS